MQLEDKKRKNHILEILVPFFGVLAPYRVAIIPASAILLLIIILFKDGGKVRLPRTISAYIGFVVYLIARDVFHMFFSTTGVSIRAQVNGLLEDVVLYLMIYIVSNGDFDEDVLFKSWRIAGVIFGAGMLYHVYQLLVLGQDIYPISFIPGYDIAHEAGEMSGRPTSFFSEPAAYVNSMLPLLFLSLRKRKFFWAAISAFLIVISTSTVGVILTAVMWVVFILLERKSVMTTVLYIAFAAVFVMLFLNLSVFSDSLEKLQDVTEGESTWGSRVEGPILMVKAMNWWEFPLGTSVVDTIKFVFERIQRIPAGSRPYMYAMSGKAVFMNTYCKLIFRYGIAGLLLFLSIFKGKVLNKKYDARIYAIAMLVAAIAQGMTASPDMPLLIIVLYESRMNCRKVRIAPSPNNK